MNEQQFWPEKSQNLKECCRAFRILRNEVWIILWGKLSRLTEVWQGKFIVDSSECQFQSRDQLQEGLWPSYSMLSLRKKISSVLEWAAHWICVERWTAAEMSHTDPCLKWVLISWWPLAVNSFKIFRFQSKVLSALEWLSTNDCLRWCSFNSNSDLNLAIPSPHRTPLIGNPRSVVPRWAKKTLQSQQGLMIISSCPAFPSFPSMGVIHKIFHTPNFILSSSSQRIQLASTSQSSYILWCH